MVNPTSLLIPAIATISLISLLSNAYDYASEATEEQTKNNNYVSTKQKSHSTAARTIKTNTTTTQAAVVNANSTQLPLVINTWFFDQANAHAWRILNHRKGGINQTLNAVVEGCTYCERAQCDGSVGYGGSPDELGETTLDAMIMNGANMNIGAVAGLRRIKDAMHVAKMVLQHTRHTLLVGDAATRFAIAMGFREESLATNNSRSIWQQWQARNCQPNYWQNVHPDASVSCGPYVPGPTKYAHEQQQQQFSRFAYKIGPDNHDTIGMIAIDTLGQIHAGTSTNGATHKIPGRVGDSPIPGAGAYADNDVGAAVATGDGDIMMRFLPSLLAVEAMRAGQTPQTAANQAMQRIVKHHSDFSGALVVAHKSGAYAAACVGMEQFPFSVTNGNAEHAITRIEYTKCIKKKAKDSGEAVKK